jgi:hypothetical protein
MGWMTWISKDRKLRAENLGLIRLIISRICILMGIVWILRDRMMSTLFEIAEVDSYSILVKPEGDTSID